MRIWTLILQRISGAINLCLQPFFSSFHEQTEPSQHRPVNRLLCALLLISSSFSVAHAEPDTWILIDAAGRSLSVMQDDQMIEDYPGISLGRNGYAADRSEGDGKTPLGEFHIAWVNPESRYRRFFGLDYPNLERAELAFQRNRIDTSTYSEIRQALSNGKIPPQTTTLGGYIGIHGVGNGDPRIHKISDWTQGCIALTNAQLDALQKWIKIGTRVVITDGLNS